MASNKERTGNVKYDLGTFVVSVNRLKSQGKPVLVLFSVVSNVVRYVKVIWLTVFFEDLLCYVRTHLQGTLMVGVVT